MAGPIITRVKGWLFPDKTPEPDSDVSPTPEPQPDTPTPPKQDDVPVARPSAIQAVNYIRAFLILKNLPLKKLRDSFFKLPLRQIFWVIGLCIWVYMSYALVKLLLNTVFGF